jgi:hypothetical protein
MTDPFPLGSTVQTIFVDEAGNVISASEATNAAGGEILVTYPDGRIESTIFSTSDAPPPPI